MNQRAYALDALRGYAIITMVLCSSIAWGILPAWMYHAQIPPPDHIHNPNLAGLTWVDLVFPFFLFAMGAAFPFSIGKRIEKGESLLRLLWDALSRGLQLTVFAVFIQHFYPYVLSAPQDARSWLLALTAFALLFPMFMRMPFKMPSWAHLGIKLSAFILAFVLLMNVKYADGRVWSLDYSNIIILVLANMAFWGSSLYLFTRKNRWTRIVVLVCLMGIMLSAQVEGTWTKALYNFTPFPWMYKFVFLKYLFIVVPGTIAGEYLMEWITERAANTTQEVKDDRRGPVLLLCLATGLIVLNLCLLQSRLVEINAVVTFSLLALGCLLLRKAEGGYRKLWRNLFYAGTYLLIIGLCFESYEGGIKKDPSTFSYYFVTSGLAFMALLIFNIICDFYGHIRSTRFLVMSGQNPMIAYVSESLLIMPLFGLLGVTPLLSYLSANPWLGFLRGVLITSIAVLVTMFFSRIKWFWRT